MARNRREQVQFPQILNFKTNLQEKEEVNKLTALLPLCSLVRDQLDKSSVIRLAISHLQLRRLLADPIHVLRSTPSYPSPSSSFTINADYFPQSVSAFHPTRSIQQQQSTSSRMIGEPKRKSIDNIEVIMNRELEQKFAFNVFSSTDGFLVMVDGRGRMVYVSETASVHVGLSQVDMIGNIITSVVHADDAEMLKKLLAIGVDSVLFPHSFNAMIVYFRAW